MSGGSLHQAYHSYLNSDYANACIGNDLLCSEAWDLLLQLRGHGCCAGLALGVRQTFFFGYRSKVVAKWT
jgi:hypothetical protein